MVEGFTGLPGCGKTYWITKLALDALKNKREVYANFSIKGAKKYQKLSDIFWVRKGVILVDEINLVCPSRWWNKFPPELAYFWSQTRKFGLDIFWTAQHIDRVDKIIREISNYVSWIKIFPLGIRRIKKYLPEQINKEKKDCYKRTWFKIDKKIYKYYDTLEPIEITF